MKYQMHGFPINDKCWIARVTVRQRAREITVAKPLGYSRPLGLPACATMKAQMVAVSYTQHPNFAQRNCMKDQLAQVGSGRFCC